jgi:hypothetical protein
MGDALSAMPWIPSRLPPLLAQVLMAKSGNLLARLAIRSGSQSQGCRETK